MKVLVVDPQEPSRDALRRAFAAQGCAVRGFASLAEAEAVLAEFGPDLVAAALDVPGDGAAFLIRASAGDPKRSVFALVDAADLDRAVAAVNAGADDFLWRPVSAARVAQLVRAARTRRERESESEETRLRLARAELRDAPARPLGTLGRRPVVSRAGAPRATHRS